MDKAKELLNFLLIFAMKWVLVLIAFGIVVFMVSTAEDIREGSEQGKSWHTSITGE